MCIRDRTKPFHFSLYKKQPLFFVLSHFFVFACHLLWSELDGRKKNKNDNNTNHPKTFVHVLSESGLSLHIVIFYLLEVGVAGGGADVPLDFRAHFLSTWLGLTVLGAFPVSLGARTWVSVVKVLLVQDGYGFGVLYSIYR